MSNPSHLIQAAFNAPNLPRKSIGQRAYVGLLIATTGASVLCGGAAHSGPCTLQITQLERQIQHAGSSLESGPTAPQSVVGLLHHQPTPDTVLNAERKANSDAAAALDRVDGSAVACAKAFDEAKHHWIIPPLS